MHPKFSIIFFLIVALSIPSIPAEASPFTIDGSTVYVNGGFVGIRTSTPATTLDVNGDAQFGSGSTKSTFTATGLLKLTSSGVQWADGTTSTTAVSGSGGGSTLAITTCATGGISANFTNTTFSTALTTVTFTTTGHKVAVSFNASGCHDGAFAVISCGFLQDGAFTTGYSNTVGASFVEQATGCAEQAMIGYTAVVAAPSAGSHSYALVCRVGAATGHFNYSGGMLPQFCAQEVP